MAATSRSWQLKAQRRRRTLHYASNGRDRRDCLLFIGVALAACALCAMLLATTHSRFDDNNDTTRRVRIVEPLASHVMRFVRAYPQRFYTFYAPKIELLGQWLRSAADAFELSADASASLGFTVALVSVVSVYHVIEIGRRALLTRLQHTQTSSRGERGEDARVCDAS